MIGDTGLVVLAHGIGGRSDLPVPMWLAMYAGAVAVLVSFFGLAALWRTPRLTGGTAGRPLPALERFVDGRVVRIGLPVLGVLLLAVFLLVAWLGPNDDGRGNPAPTWIYAWFWVGLVPVSLTLGPIWRRMNPLRAVAGLIRRAVPAPRVALPERWGHRPASFFLLTFLWLELVYDEAASPRTVALFVSAYAVVQIIGGVVAGQTWFDRADGFEAYSRMIARASPLGRRDDGRLVLRNPLDGLAATPTVPSIVPIVLVVLGSTAFDGLSRTSVWSELTAGTGRTAYLLLGTLGLLLGLGAFALTYSVAIRLTRPYLRDAVRARLEFAHTLIPIAIGYTIAHYFSFALFQGQQGILLADDPFVRGWSLFGLTATRPDYSVMPPVLIAIVQTSAIVVGHVAGVTAAHDRSIRLLDPVYMRTGQYPMLVVMVAYTIAGIALIAGA